jgi:hypothetical protein
MRPVLSYEFWVLRWKQTKSVGRLEQSMHRLNRVKSTTDLPVLRLCSIERVVLLSVDRSHKKGASINSH